MFERYTVKARRVIFFARYEASQFGSPLIETEHLLLGLLREDKALTNLFPASYASADLIRKDIEGHTLIREKVSTSVDYPLSNECKRALAYAAEEAERLSHRHIGTEHLLLGLLREQNCGATKILHEHGVKLEAIRNALQQSRSDRAALDRAAAVAEHRQEKIRRTTTERQLEPVIAERVLHSAKLNAQIVVRIGIPREMVNKQFVTPYQVVGLGDANVRLAAGADAVQALQLAFLLIGAELKSCDVRWAGGPDSGFPTT
jgi:ATP-dependent Clp protease ATP-binding subunit ClpA